ncbi:hypothetical protein DMB66_58045 [Actinoplanes sp. ATCC 53533]|uniref:hypothetical protein n=1 Tax=Actinoplanes sp. ATCC 53533 TaxID=1288362 RepID=UPI000F7A15E3|nr:hypothetical protein [Actinoplanes sp. ATCC 53533]RSM39606.1 hypothetical protein DMB66_58045 [Actinoplanes sp. ATCC 53533]
MESFYASVQQRWPTGRLDYHWHVLPDPVQTRTALFEPYRELTHRDGLAPVSPNWYHVTVLHSVPVDEVTASELDSRLTRSVTQVAANTTVREQSTEIHRIGARTLHEPGTDAWSIAAGTWRALHRRQQPPDTIGPAVLAAVLARYDHVHDLAALPCQPQVPVTDTDCLHTWALRVYHAHISDVVQQWLTGLSQALADLTSAQATGTDYAVALPLWPPTRDCDAPLAFLTQFPLLAAVDRYVGRHPDWWGHADGNTFRWQDGYETHRPQIAIVRVPGYAAEQATAISPKLLVEPLPGGRAARATIRNLLTRCGLPLLPQDVLSWVFWPHNSRVLWPHIRSLMRIRRSELQLQLAPAIPFRGTAVWLAAGSCDIDRGQRPQVWPCPLATAGPRDSVASRPQAGAAAPRPPSRSMRVGPR